MKPLRVLIVDDEEELVQALTERLKLRDVDAEGCTTGWEALNLVKEKQFDVLLVDVKMPSMGGLQVLAEVKKMLPDAQVVLLTGHGSTHDAREGLRLGAYEYLMKPVKIDELMDTLRAAAEGKKRTEP